MDQALSGHQLSDVKSRRVSFNDAMGLGAGNHQVITASTLGPGNVLSMDVVAFSGAAAVGATHR